ncbi:MAG: hypothetical protein ACPGYL_01170 [Rhodospirillaceae bacterium]
MRQSARTSLDVTIEHSFEVHVFNAMVRALRGAKAHHGDLSDGWADLQHREVKAHSLEEARMLAARIYPPGDGYVITGVVARP